MGEGKYGTHLNVYDWQERRILQRIDLGLEGTMPLEIRCASANIKNKKKKLIGGKNNFCFFCKN